MVGFDHMAVYSAGHVERRLPNGLGESGAGYAALGMFGPAIAALIMHAIHGNSIKGTLGIRRPWRY